MNNALYTVTSYEALTFKGTVNANATSISVTKDDNTVVSVPIANFFSDFKNDTIEIVITAKASNEDKESSPDIYDIINELTPSELI